MNILLGWILLAMVAVLANVAALPLRRRAKTYPRALLIAFVAVMPCVFVGWALARFGVRLLGGGS